jgi:hypothetical protein
VASYFCRPDGTVIHAVPGPVKAGTFLREARWAVAAHTFAQAEGGADPVRYAAALRKAHLDRLRQDFGVSVQTTLPRVASGLPPDESLLHSPAVQHQGNQARVSLLLAYYPLPKLNDLYPLIWEKVLNERVSLAPVQVVRR